MDFIKICSCLSEQIYVVLRYIHEITIFIVNILFKGVNFAIQKSVNLTAEGQDNLANALYSRLFSWLVIKVNSCLKGRDEGHR